MLKNGKITVPTAVGVGTVGAFYGMQRVGSKTGETSGQKTADESLKVRRNTASRVRSKTEKRGKENGKVFSINRIW